MWMNPKGKMTKNVGSVCSGNQIHICKQTLPSSSIKQERGLLGILRSELLRYLPLLVLPVLKICLLISYFNSLRLPFFYFLSLCLLCILTSLGCCSYPKAGWFNFFCHFQLFFLLLLLKRRKKCVYKVIAKALHMSKRQAVALIKWDPNPGGRKARIPVTGKIEKNKKSKANSSIQ